jgi:uncharacterized Zn finger protein
MSRFSNHWRPYVSVGARRAEALREMEKLREKGTVIQPVEIEGRTIARSFWGKGWCTHLESFGDYSNRLPRGRTYARNGSVCHLEIQETKVEAIVSGSELYEVEVEIAPLKKARWQKLKKQCTGKIGSLIELLQGRFSDEIMGIVTDRSQGLFPQPGEISFQCNCPDWADMCKHIAAAMYGIGARLDEEPELLFLLRGVDREELITADAAASEIVGKGSKRSRRRSLADKDLASVFDVELEERSEKATKRKGTKGKATKKVAAKKNVAAKKKSVKRKSASSGASKRSSKKKGAKRAPASFRPSAAAVARLRRRLGMSKIEFASAVGVSSATVTKWEGASGTIRPNSKGLAGLNRLHRGQE